MNFSWSSGTPNGSHIETLISAILAPQVVSSPIVREGESSSQGYTSLQDAYNGITGSSETIKMKAGEITEDLFFDDNRYSSTQGGVRRLFGIDAGYTKIKGIVRILHGKVVVSKVIIAPAF